MVQKVAPVYSSGLLAYINPPKAIGFVITLLAGYAFIQIVRSLVGRATPPLLLTEQDKRALVLYAQGIESQYSMESLGKFLQASPQTPYLRAGIHLRIAENWMSLGQFNKVIEELNQSLAIQPADKTLTIEALILRAKASNAIALHDAALIDLAEALQNSPTLTEKIKIAIYQSKIYCYKGDYIKGWQSTQFFMTGEPRKNGPICRLLVDLAETYLKVGGVEFARSYIEQAFKALHSADNGYLRALCYFVSGQIRLLEGVRSEARTDFEEAQKCNHTDQELQRRISAELQKLALPPLASSFPAAAVSRIKTAQDVNEEAQTLIDQGFDYLDNLRLTEAQILFNKADNLTPTDFNIQAKIATGFAEIQWKQEKYQEALQYFDQVLRINPSDENLIREALVCKGDIYIVRECRREAVNAFTQALAFHPSAVEEARILLRISYVHYLEGHAKTGLTKCQQALKVCTDVDEKIGEFLIELCQVAHAHDPQQAQQYLEWSFNYFPEGQNLGRSLAFYNKAAFLSEAGQYVACYEQLKQALDSVPAAAVFRFDIHSQMGHVALKLEDKALARGHFREALKLDPHNPEIIEKLDRIG